MLAGPPQSHDLVFPWYYRVYVSMGRWSSGQLTIRRPCHRCGHDHVLAVLTDRGAESWEVIAIAYSRAHWERCEACGFTLALARSRPAKDAFAAELLDRIRRLLSYPNLVDGELAVLTCMAIPRQQPRQAQPLAPLCPVCGDPVGLRRDGSPFPTCFQHR